MVDGGPVRIATKSVAWRMKYKITSIGGIPIFTYSKVAIISLERVNTNSKIVQKCRVSLENMAGYPTFIIDMLILKLTVKGYNITESIISQDYNLISPITDIVCINFIHERRHPQFGVDSESQFFFFEKLLGASI